MEWLERMLSTGCEKTTTEFLSKGKGAKLLMYEIVCTGVIMIVFVKVKC